MALTLTVFSEAKPLQLPWYVGIPTAGVRAAARSAYSNPDMLIQVAAEGEELIHIRNKFKNIPDVPSNQAMTWFDETAFFIATNI